MEAFLYLILSGLILVGAVALIALIPSALIFAGYKKGIYWLAGITLVISAASMLFAGVLGGLCIFITLLSFTYMILYCMQQKIGLVKTVAVSVFVLLLMSVISYFILREQLGLTAELFDRIAEELAPSFKEYLATLYDDLEDADVVILTREYITMSIPSLLIGFSVILGVTVYSMSASMINKKAEKEKHVRYIPFEMWDIPSNVGCFMAVCLLVILFLWNIFDWAEILVMTGMTVYFIFMGIQGASFIIFFQKRNRMPAIPAWFILALLISVVPMLVILLGIIDKFFRIKLSYMIKHGMIKVRKIDPGNFTNGSITKIIDENGRIVDENGESKYEEISDDDDTIIDDEPDDDSNDDNDNNNDDNDNNEN